MSVTLQEKEGKYKDLIHDVNTFDCNGHLNMTPKGTKRNIELKTSPECEEINLWSYWQGGKEQLTSARLLVVGQDWGPLDEADNSPDGIGRMASAYRHISTGKFLEGKPACETDKNLYKIFKDVFGYDLDEKHADLFFTNYVPWYRVGDKGNGFEESWIKPCSDFFKRLVEIIEPVAIACLGRYAYKGVLSTAGENEYNAIINGGTVDLCFGETHARVFPLSHPSSQGQLNRNKTAHSLQDLDGLKSDPLYLVKRDWLNVKKYLENDKTRG